MTIPVSGVAMSETLDTTGFFSSSGRLSARTVLAADRSSVFAFFSDAANLGVITPREMHFRIRSAVPIVMAEGTLIDYTIRVWGIPLTWRTRIVSWDPPHGFVDEQLRGPYRTWVHTHRFTDGANGTVMEDEVTWSLPFGWLGRLANPLVRRQVERIFAFRGACVQEIFGSAD